MLLHGSAAVGDGVLRHLAYLPEYVDAAAEARMLAEVHNAPQGKWVQVSRAGVFSVGQCWRCFR